MKAVLGVMSFIVGALRKGFQRLSACSALSVRRAVAVVIALSLWMGAGTMSASQMPKKDTGEVFGAVHWYERER